VFHGQTNFKLFTDDAKFYGEMSEMCNQTSFNNLATWADAWQLSINVLRTVKTKCTNHSGSNSYDLNSVLLANNEHVYVCELLYRQISSSARMLIIWLQNV